MSSNSHKDGESEKIESDLDFLFRSYPTPFEISDIEFLRDTLFIVGVPAKFPLKFKKMVFAAGKAFTLGNKSIDYTLKRYGENWKFSSQKSEHISLFNEIVDFVRTTTKEEIKRFSLISNKADHHGLFAAGSALLRLETSFSVACLLLRQFFWIELACIEKLIFEQICWSYCVRHLEGDELYATSPTSSVHKFKKLYPQAGRIYGYLNKISHISPEESGQYIDVSDITKPGVYLASAKETATCAHLLLFLVDMFQVCAEYIYSDYYKSLLHTKRCDGQIQINPKRKTKAAILKFQQRLRDIKSA